ncbi:hypothetical protein C8J56DRAFT_296635 [Mycena floridula]|nr:hypothetical protein C8J56DRAFT_296635 [Mycena floridula]
MSSDSLFTSRRSRRLSGQAQKRYFTEISDGSDEELSYPDSSSYDPASPSPSVASCESASPPPAFSQVTSSHTRKHKEDHIPRPPNAFMLYRSDLWRQQRENPVERDHRQISRIAGLCWNRLSPEEKRPWEDAAAQRKALHAKENPDYKYRPASKRSRPSKRPRHDTATEKARCAIIADQLVPGPAVLKQEEETVYLQPAPVVESPHVDHETLDFIPTADIPSLDLNATASPVPVAPKPIYPAFSFRPALYREPEQLVDPLVVPQSYRYIPPQFGGYQPETVDWYSEFEDVLWRENLCSSPPCKQSPSEMQFTVANFYTFFDRDQINQDFCF